jgi:hypothetical protein
MKINLIKDIALGLTCFGAFWFFGIFVLDFLAHRSWGWIRHYANGFFSRRDQEDLEAYANNLQTEMEQDGVFALDSEDLAQLDMEITEGIMIDELLRQTELEITEGMTLDHEDFMDAESSEAGNEGDDISEGVAEGGNAEGEAIGDPVEVPDVESDDVEEFGSSLGLPESADLENLEGNFEPVNMSEDWDVVSTRSEEEVSNGTKELVEKFLKFHANTDIVANDYYDEDEEIVKLFLVREENENKKDS